jgi:formylglycine-generating enzyme required for sulfatase activity
MVTKVIALAGVLALAACEKAQPERRDEPAPVPATRDAREPPGKDANLAELLDGLEPVDPPPPPIVRKYRQGDCKPEYAPRPTRDPNPMCKVDGGTFELDVVVTEPPKLTTVKGFYIDQFEVTAAQAARFLNALGHNECYGADAAFPVCVFDVDNGRLDLIRKKDRFVVHPGSEERAAKFTIQGALRYCAWVGKRAPSLAQWEYAARHDPRTNRDLDYPWGDRWDADRVYIENPNRGPFLPGGSMPVGSFDGTERPDGSSPWGLHDQIGNIWELVVRCARPDDGCGIACPCRTVRYYPKETLANVLHETDADEPLIIGVRCVRSLP